MFKLNILFLFYSIVNPRILMGITTSIKQLLKKKERKMEYGLILCLANFVIKLQNTYSINALAHFVIFL